MRYVPIGFFSALLLIFGGFAYGADTAPKGGNPVVLLETSMGNIKVELNPQEAPISVRNNFV